MNFRSTWLSSTARTWRRSGDVNLEGSLAISIFIGSITSAMWYYWIFKRNREKEQNVILKVGWYGRIWCLKQWTLWDVYIFKSWQKIKREHIKSRDFAYLLDFVNLLSKSLFVFYINIYKKIHRWKIEN